MDVVGGHKNKPALNLAGVEVARQFSNDDRTFVFVSMIAALEDDGWTFAVGDDGDRNRRDAPGVLMRRMRKHHGSDLPALPIKIDAGEGGGGTSRLRFMHVPHFLSPWPRDV